MLFILLSKACCCKRGFDNWASSALQQTQHDKEAEIQSAGLHCSASITGQDYVWASCCTACVRLKPQQVLGARLQSRPEVQAPESTERHNKKTNCAQEAPDHCLKTDLTAVLFALASLCIWQGHRAVFTSTQRTYSEVSAIEDVLKLLQDSNADCGQQHCLVGRSSLHFTTLLYQPLENDT